MDGWMDGILKVDGQIMDGWMDPGGFVCFIVLYNKKHFKSLLITPTLNLTLKHKHTQI